MKIIIIILAGLFLLAVIAFIAGIFHNRNIKKKIEKGELEDFPDIKKIQAMECCGQHEVCEKDSLLAAVSKKIVYYDDEELDRFKGTPSDAYTETDAEEFREILYTMKEVEVAGWVRSLQLRNVELPDQLKDEVFLIVGERRN